MRQSTQDAKEIEQCINALGTWLESQGDAINVGIWLAALCTVTGMVLDALLEQATPEQRLTIFRDHIGMVANSVQTLQVGEIHLLPVPDSLTKN